MHAAPQPSRMTTFLAWFGLLLGSMLLGAGLLVPDGGLWRLILVVALWLFSWLPRLLIRRIAVAGRGMAHLALACCLGFGAVAAQLAREQISQAGATRARVIAMRTLPEQPDAEPLRTADRTALGSGRIWPLAEAAPTRGRIFDRNGVVLATNEAGRRAYPNPDLGHIVGFQSRLYGTSGIEAGYDDALEGAGMLPPEALLEARLLGTALPPVVGADVYLTIDSRLQQAAQIALGDRAGAVVLLDTQTGAIVALASAPRFDPNTLVLPLGAGQADVDRVQAAWTALLERGDSPLLNRATQGRYPPGSVIKTLTAAAALDAGVLSGPDSPVTCPNRLETEAGAPPVRNAVENLDRRTGDPSDLVRVFAFSCNTAFAQIGLALGPQRFADYAARFGMGLGDTPQPADLREIAADAGTIAGSADFLARPVALADTAFGQGQALVTPLDMARMVAVIANEGLLLRPYLVERVMHDDTLIYQARPEIVRDALGGLATRHMRLIMQRSVEIGYAAPVALPGVTIGAKTGTAETPTGVPHSWFVAFAPVEQPRYAIAVIIEYGGEGSRGALPVAREVLAAALGVQP
ncbi:MAG TPA: penicillin-binding transpeptidase domain-containing protein [Roseiflexaceae bacterium]|nr:penicillin-binding transpeptidase domain-containing protein [Roseiflexaceae bacterium]